VQQLFGKLYIPQAVYNEVVAFGQGRVGSDEVRKAAWIETVKVKDRLAVEALLDELDLGEAETIVLAREIDADWVLMDERKGRRKLKELGLQKIGTIGILLKAKQERILPSIRRDIEQLHKKGFSLSQSVITSVLHQANE
jgi:predicted nucleic acid-binding protein